MSQEVSSPDDKGELLIEVLNRLGIHLAILSKPVTCLTPCPEWIRTHLDELDTVVANEKITLVSPLNDEYVARIAPITVDGKPIVYIMPEQGEVVQLQHKIQELKQQLKWAQEEIDSYVRSLAHDLRTPLRAIMSFTELLHSEIREDLPQDVLQNLQIILDNAEKMEQLYNSLVELAKVTTSDLVISRVSLSELLTTISQIPNKYLQKTTINIPKQLPVIEGDPEKLRMVFTELILNAAKFNSNPRPRVEITWQDLGDRVRIKVTDNGIGIPPESRNRVFWVFQQLNPNSEGFGVGLYRCKRIIERHKGTIAIVDSQPGIGTTFAITLPRKQSKQNDYNI